MKGYTIQNSIDLLEKNGGGSGGASSAANVSFDNTDTGLVGTNVQSAIEEVNVNLVNAVTYSNEEIKIGTYNGKDLYRKMITITGFTSDQAIVANQIYFGTVDISDYLTGVEACFADILHSYIDTGATKRSFIFQQYEPDSGNMTLGTLYERTNVDALLVLEYTKVSTTTKLRKKKEGGNKHEIS